MESLVLYQCYLAAAFLGRYTLFEKDGVTPLGWPVGGEPKPQGPYALPRCFQIGGDQ